MPRRSRGSKACTVCKRDSERVCLSCGRPVCDEHRLHLSGCPADAPASKHLFSPLLLTFTGALVFSIVNPVMELGIALLVSAATAVGSSSVTALMCWTAEGAPRRLWNRRLQNRALPAARIARRGD